MLARTRIARLLVVALAAGAALGSNCNRTESRVGAGLPCSTSADDDPHFTCDPRLDLVCIDTGVSKQYTCRVPCEVGDRACGAGEFCCPGVIFGNAKVGEKTYTRGCADAKHCTVSGDGGSDYVGEGGGSSDGGPFGN